MEIAFALWLLLVVDITVPPEPERVHIIYPNRRVKKFKSIKGG